MILFAALESAPTIQLDLTQIILGLISIISPIALGIIRLMQRRMELKMQSQKSALESDVELRIREAVDKAMSESSYTKPENLGEIKVQYHSLFSQMDLWIMYFETSFSLPNKGKEMVIRDALIHKFTIWRDNLRELAIEVDKCVDECDNVNYCNKLSNLNFACFTKSINEYNTYYHNSSYSADEKECLDIFMKKFAKWHGERIKTVEQSIQKSCSSDFYKGHCRIVQAIILDIYQGAFAETMNDVEDTIGDINGDFAGKMFRGQLI